MGLLVLSRKEGESIVIGDNIVVTVVRLNQVEVRLSIAAPLDVSIDRQEIWIRKQREKAKLETTE